MTQTSQTQTLPINIEANQSILDEYANLRWHSSLIEAKLKEIEPIAVEEALKIIGDGKAANGKQKVYSSPLCDITLQWSTTKVKDSEHQDLEHLAEMIEIESEKACYQNKEAIASLKQQIALLELDSAKFLSGEEISIKKNISLLEP